MTLLSIELQTDNSASNNDNFCEALIEELRYHDFMKNYVRPRLEEEFGVKIEVNRVPAYCRRLSVNADSEQIGFLVEERFNELCMDFLFWVESDRDFIVTSIDWENTDDAQEAELQIERLLKCGVSEHDAIYRVTQNIFSKYEIYPQSGHAIEIN